MAKITLQGLKDYWWIIAIAAVIGGMEARNTIAVEGAKAHASKVEKVLERQTALQAELQGQFSVILTLLGVKAEDSTVMRWRDMPKEPPLDSIGEPVEGTTWLCVSHDYLVGKTYQFREGDTVMVRIEWDARPDSIRDGP